MSSSQPLEKLVIKPTTTTPSIIFDNESGILEIKGRSLPEDTQDFFGLVMDWLRKYALNPAKETEVNISFVYLKTSAFKMMFDVFKVLEKIKAAGNKVVVNWYYEEDDEEIKEMGRDYVEVIDLPFNLISVPD